MHGDSRSPSSSRYSATAALRRAAQRDHRDQTQRIVVQLVAISCFHRNTQTPFTSARSPVARRLACRLTLVELHCAEIPARIVALPKKASRVACLSRRPRDHLASTHALRRNIRGLAD